MVNSKLKLKVGQFRVREGGEQPLSRASTQEGTSQRKLNDRMMRVLQCEEKTKIKLPPAASSHSIHRQDHPRCSPSASLNPFCDLSTPSPLWRLSAVVAAQAPAPRGSEEGCVLIFKHWSSESFWNRHKAIPPKQSVAGGSSLSQVYLLKLGSK